MQNITTLELQPGSEWHSGQRQPGSTRYKVCHWETGRHIRTRYNMVTGPLDPASSGSTRTEIMVLPVIQSRQRKIGIFPPWPPLGDHKTIYETLHNHSPRVLLPGSTQISFKGPDNRFEVGCGHDPRVVDGDTRILERVTSALGCDDVGLPYQRFPDINNAVLEDDGGVSKNEINGSIDVAWFVELTLRMDEESVLVPFEPARVEHGQIRRWPKRHRLPPLWPRSVAECDSPGYESYAINPCPDTILYKLIIKHHLLVFKIRN